MTDLFIIILTAHKRRVWGYHPLRSNISKTALASHGPAKTKSPAVQSFLCVEIKSKNHRICGGSVLGQLACKLRHTENVRQYKRNNMPYAIVSWSFKNAV